MCLVQEEHGRSLYGLGRHRALPGVPQSQGSRAAISYRATTDV